MSDTIWSRLAEPFPFEDVKVMPQTTSKDMTKALAVAYFDARAVMNRLDEVLTPAGWRAEYREMAISEKAKGVVCRLTVYAGDREVVREDGSDPSDIEGFKGAISGALKRAFSALCNRSLYETDLGWHPIETYEGGGGKKFKGWTDAALMEMKRRYDRQTGIAPTPVPTNPPHDSRARSVEDGEPWLKSIGMGRFLTPFKEDCEARRRPWMDVAKAARLADVRNTDQMSEFMKNLEAVPA